MKKVNMQKAWAVGIIVGFMGTAVLGFQNFVPHDPFRGHDTGDIYMNTALTDALKQAEKERRTKSLHPSQVQGDEKPEAKIGTAERLPTSEKPALTH